MYAMPVLPSYFLSHQWKTMIGVHFRVPDREPVVVGHYNAAHQAMTAARAVRIIMEAPDARGYEVVIPRKIEPKAIHAIRAVSQIVGWRYHPDSHGKHPCGCPVCVSAPAGFKLVGIELAVHEFAILRESSPKRCASVA